MIRTSCSLTMLFALIIPSNDTAEWAGMGECDNNPGYMLSHCEDSCQKHAEVALREAGDIKVRFAVGMWASDDLFIYG